jgi:hypothetical protein
MVWGIFKKDTVSEAYKKMKDCATEELKGDQHKLDKNKNGKIDGDDLAKLRATKEEVEQLDEYESKDGVYKHQAKPGRYGGTEKDSDYVKGPSDAELKKIEAKKKKSVKEEAELEELEDGTFYDGSDMLGEAQARYSTSYQFTHKPGDEESEKKLADLKKSVKGTGKRVVLQGRLGKNNPNAHKYSKNAPQGTFVNGKRTNSDVSGKSGAHTHQRIQKADAAHHDVYVYDKADTQYDIDTTIFESLSVFNDKELDMLINEVLSKDASAGTWIKDFVKSDAPQFAGKSKEKRKQMALAAYYGAQKNESTDYDDYVVLDEEKQADVVKMGAKEIKHANMKDKQDDQEVMEPHSGTEQKFLGAHSVRVTDDPTRDKQDAGTVTRASEPSGKGPGSYDAKEKLGNQKTGIKEAIIKTAAGEEIDTTPGEKKAKSEKTSPVKGQKVSGDDNDHS